MALCGLAFAASSAAVRDARAAAVDLVWSAPGECPQQRDVEADIQHRIAELKEADRRASVHVVARVERLEAEYVLRLQTAADGASTERDIRAARCEELARAAALIVAVLVDARATPGDEPAPEPASSPDPALPEPPPPSREPDEDPGPPADSHPFVDLAVAVDLGALPAIGLGPALGLGWIYGALRAELFGLYLPVQELVLEDRPLPVAALQLMTAGLGACYALLGAPVLGGCLHMEYGRVWGESRNVTDKGSGGSAWWLVAPGLRLDLRIAGGLSLGLQLSAGILLEQVTFFIDGIGPVHEVAPIVGRLRAGATWRF